MEINNFSHAAGTAVTLYYCIQSLIVGGLGTAATIVLSGDSAWPLIAYCLNVATATFVAMAIARLLRLGPRACAPFRSP